MEARDFVRMEEWRLSLKDVEHEKEERRQYERRADKRMDALELQQRRQSEILTGKDGKNGLLSRVSLAEHIIGRHERWLWMLGGSVLTAIVGGAVKLFGS